MAEGATRSGSSRFMGSRWERTVRKFIAYTPDGDSIPEETWNGRHRNILILLVAHVPFLFLLGISDGTESLITGATLPEFPWLSS
ncbi:hypothetical protein VB773_16760 [Haloarculaceae archaeon H-GB2-1]|nr:hypothetical protein [Haloarculaceae archaeon H-GB11]MEA5409057.1 hypothetical protein [Haloarculaceae archaeon H-GB2-1]